MSKLICVFHTDSAIEAELIRSNFENAGIICFIKSNDASGVLPHLRGERGIEIMVQEENLEQAQVILAESE